MTDHLSYGFNLILHYCHHINALELFSLRISAATNVFNGDIEGTGHLDCGSFCI